MKPIADCRLYGILDLGYADRASLARAASAMIDGGIDVIQLRAKGHAPGDILEMGRAILPLAREAGVPFIVNDHPAVAGELGADGFHLGQDDGSLAEARAAAGRPMLAGRSTHSLAQARAAAAEGADYIGFGPLFATPTKPDYPPIGIADIVRVQAERPGLPVFCIGGIKLENLPALVAAGTRRAVIVSGILLAPDLAAATRAAKALLERAGNPPLT